MSSKKAKRLKKIFVYFLGAYFLIAGVLISGGNVMATEKGAACTADSQCTPDNGALQFCDGKKCAHTDACQYTSDCQTEFDDASLLCGGEVSHLKNGQIFGPKINNIQYNGVCRHAMTAALSEYCQVNSDCITGSCTVSSSGGVGKCTASDAGVAEDYKPIAAFVAKPLYFTPEIPIPGTTFQGTMKVGYASGTNMESDLFRNYIGAIYRYGLSIIGIIATVTLMGGGIVWLTSAGNDSKVTQAKEMIFGSLIGIALLFGAYMILNTINPALVQLKPIESPSIAQVTADVVCCQFNDRAQIMIANDCKKQGGKRMTDYLIDDNNSKLCIKTGCCISYKVWGGDWTYQSCNASLQSDCARVDNLAFGTIWQTQKCETDAKCTKIDSKGAENHFNACNNAKDGSSCSVGTESGYCYDNVCKIKPAQLGQKCGNDGGICTNNWHHNEVTGTLGYVANLFTVGYAGVNTDMLACDDPARPTHDLGGLSCNSGLLCCCP